MNIGLSSRLLAITIIFVLIFVSATTVLDTYAKKTIIKKPIKVTGSLTEPLAKRTKTIEIQIEKTKIAKIPYKIEYRDDLLINVDKYTREFNTDLFNSLIANMVAILPYLIS